MNKKTIVAIPGSIRSGSYNKKVCRHLATLGSESVSVENFEIDNLPMFNADLENNLPKEVQDLVDALAGADGVIISTPEYNNMMPGALKNMCEWLTRSYSAHAVKDKPLAITGATDGGFGTVRAQNQLMMLANIMGFKVDAKLRLPISHADQIFDDSGSLTDEKVQSQLKNLLDGLVECC